MKNSFYKYEDLKELGFKSIGENCLISKNASFYDTGKMIIGDNVRIDDFCILSGKIKIGSFVHISAYCALYGSNGIEIGNFSGTSPRTIIFSATDDFSGEYLINPMVPKKFTKVKGGLVKLNDFVQLGANTIVLPNITIGIGTITGAFTFVNKSIEEWCIYYGIPAKKSGIRKSEFLKYLPQIENTQFLNQKNNEK